MVSALLERCKNAGVNVHAQSRDGANTLAHQAARRDDPGLLVLLLRAGLDPNAPNGAGSVPRSRDGRREWARRARGVGEMGEGSWRDGVTGGGWLMDHGGRSRSRLNSSTPLTLLATKDFGLTDKGPPPGPPPAWPVTGPRINSCRAYRPRR